MRSEPKNIAEIKLVGLKIRVKIPNKIDLRSSKILQLISDYREQKRFLQIPNRKNPGITFCVYTEYYSDEAGDLSFFVGEEVLSLTAMPSPLVSLVIPAGRYQKFTIDPGLMPGVAVEAWKEIGSMSPRDLGGVRTMRADFQVYEALKIKPDVPNVMGLDIFIGIE